LFNPEKSTCAYREAFGNKERSAVKEVLNYYKRRKEDPPYYGEFQKRYEALFTEKMDGQGNSRAVSTGSVACYIALRAANLRPGSEVILSPVTDSSPLFAIIECGLKPVIADCKRNSYNICPESISRLINDETSAIFLIHAGGDPADIALIEKIGDENGIEIIEDISQSPFAKAYGKENILKNVGTFGMISACSTMYRKTLQTSSSGGIIYAKNIEDYRRVLEISDRGKQTWREDYDMRDPGSASLVSLNYNTDEISCAVGHASLSRIEKVIENRQWVKKEIYDIFSENSMFILPEYKENTSPFLQPVFVKDEYLEIKSKITKQLSHNGVKLSPEYKCFVCNWDITKRLTDKIEKSNAVINYKKAFNIFLNEKCNAQNMSILKEAVKKLDNI